MKSIGEKKQVDKVFVENKLKESSDKASKSYKRVERTYYNSEKGQQSLQKCPTKLSEPRESISQAFGIKESTKQAITTKKSIDRCQQNLRAIR